ncbi:glycosyltransferase family 39 protein [Methylolobus aquaticus]|nr:glycosyltransferase family 39 protein [Methylolobus aquaticus]
MTAFRARPLLSERGARPNRLFTYWTMPRYALPLLAVLVSAVTLCFGLGAYPLLQPDEGRNAEVAREMLESGAWFVPTYDGLPYLDKPAFFFKAVALSLGAFGLSEAAARLPSVVFAAALLLLLYRFCRRHYDAATAAVAVIVVAATPLYIAFARIVIFDMTLAFFVSATILMCFEAAGADEARRRARLYTLAAACAGCATLVKGPVGFLLPTLVIGVHHALGGARGWWREAFAARNVALFFALFLPWFVGVSLQHPDFPYYGIIKESVQRFTTDEFHRTAPFYFYGVIIALCFFPWSALLPEAMVAVWRGRSRLRAVDRLFVVWAIVVVVFFSLSSSKLPGYILTASVALGVLTARLFTLAAAGNTRATGIVRRGTWGLAIVASCAAALSGSVAANPDRLGRLPVKVAEHLVPLQGAFGPLAVVLAVTAGLAVFGALRRNPRYSFAAFVLFPLALTMLTVQHIGPYATQRSAQALAGAIPPLADDVEVACYLCLPNGLPYYLGRPVTVITFRDGREFESNYIRFRLLADPNWPDAAVREPEVERWVTGRVKPVYLLVRRTDREFVRRRLQRPELEFTRLHPDYWGTWVLPRASR